MKPIESIAASYLGQQALPENAGFLCQEFEKKIRHAGWSSGAAWCGYFCRIVWADAGARITFNPDPFSSEEELLICGSALRTMRNADRSGNLNQEPVVGAVAVWRRYEGGKPTERGHLAIVVKIHPKGADHFHTIEGNTNETANHPVRKVVERKRKFEWMRTDGLRLMGFIHPKPF